ncbi:MAG: hypothetical protein JWL81_2543, partial [Verrucomicrobiales bacterium]|nr:hypothetical protein [Verrucomicrobiales bacterium]
AGEGFGGDGAVCQGAGEHVEQEAAGFMDGAGLDEAGFAADGAEGGEAEVADFDIEIVRMGA